MNTKFINNQLCIFDEYINTGKQLYSNYTLSQSILIDFINSDLDTKNRIAVGFYEPILKHFTENITRRKFMEIINIINNTLFDNFFIISTKNDDDTEILLTHNLSYSILYELFTNAKRYNQTKCKVTFLNNRFVITFYYDEKLPYTPSNDILNIGYSTKKGISGGYGMSLIQYSILFLGIHLTTVHNNSYISFHFTNDAETIKHPIYNILFTYIKENLYFFYYGISIYIPTHSTAWFISNKDVRKILSDHSEIGYRLHRKF